MNLQDFCWTKIVNVSPCFQVIINQWRNVVNKEAQKMKNMEEKEKEKNNGRTSDERERKILSRFTHEHKL